MCAYSVVKPQTTLRHVKSTCRIHVCILPRQARSRSRMLQPRACRCCHLGTQPLSLPGCLLSHRQGGTPGRWQKAPAAAPAAPPAAAAAAACTCAVPAAAVSAGCRPTASGFAAAGSVAAASARAGAGAGAGPHGGAAAPQSVHSCEARASALRNARGFGPPAGLRSARARALPARRRRRCHGPLLPKTCWSCHRMPSCPPLSAMALGVDGPAAAAETSGACCCQACCLAALFVPRPMPLSEPLKRAGVSADGPRRHSVAAMTVQWPHSARCRCRRGRLTS